jgi:hypothetical protein
MDADSQTNGQTGGREIDRGDRDFAGGMVASA